MMNIGKVGFTLMTITIIAVVSIGIFGAVSASHGPTAVAHLDNVRDFAPALGPDQDSYTVDGGVLYAGRPSSWREVHTPRGVIVNTVAIDRANPHGVYIGSANQLALYRSLDAGATWSEIPLSSEQGGITDVAIDSFQRLIYAGSDNGRVFRLRDVGSSVILSGQLVLDDAVIQVEADTSVGGMAFARTEWALYRAENYGLRWTKVDNLNSTPTTLAISGIDHATVYVGTIDRGLLSSQDGLSWQPINEGLRLGPGSRLQIDALAVDPVQPDVLYTSFSYLFGSTTLHQTPAGVSVSENSGNTWQTIESDLQDPVIALLPVTGDTGAVLALTSRSRSLMALGIAPGQMQASVTNTETPQAPTADSPVGVIVWIVTGLAALSLLLAAAEELMGALPISPGRPAASHQ